MPRGTGSQIPHAAFTNHQILRTPDSSIKETRNPVSTAPTVFDGADSRLPRLVVDRARGLWLAEHAESTTNRRFASLAIQLLLSVTEQMPNDADVLEALGTASAVSGQFDDSLKYWKRSILIEPDRDQTIRMMAILLQNSNKTKEARPYLEKYLELQPWDATMWGRQSQLLGLSGKWKEAIDAAEQSRGLDPSDQRVYQWLAECYRRIGDTRRSQEYNELFDRIQLQSAK
jgi:tetratricopeptide (TPR) repeat protein